METHQNFDGLKFTIAANGSSCWQGKPKVDLHKKIVFLVSSVRASALRDTLREARVARAAECTRAHANARRAGAPRMTDIERRYVRFG